MKLGDFFWTKLYNYERGYHRYDDTFNIIKVAKEKFDIELSFLEALNLWEYISGCLDAGWLSVENDEELVSLLSPYLEDF